MDSTQMKYEFKTKLDAMYSGTAPGFSDKAYSVFLTEAQEDIYKEVLGFSVNEKSRFTKRYDEDDLRRLGFSKLSSGKYIEPKNRLDPSIEVTFGNALRNNNFSSSIFELPNNYFYPIYEIGTCYLSSVSSPSEDSYFNVKIKDMIQANAYSELDNPFKKPNTELAWKVQYWNNTNIKRIEIIHDSNVVFKYIYLRYLKTLTPIIVGTITGTIDGYSVPTDSILDSIYHRDIIKRAVSKAEAAINDTSGYEMSKIEERT